MTITQKLAFVFTLCLGWHVEAQVIIDDFSAANGSLTTQAGGTMSQGLTQAGSPIPGGERDALLVMTGSNGASATFTQGTVNFQADAGSQARLHLIYDGSDGNAVQIDHTHLSLDVTANGTATGVLLMLTGQAGAVGRCEVVLHSGASARSSAEREWRATSNAPAPLFIPYSSLQLVAGAGANLQQITAVEVVLHAAANGGTIAVDYISSTVPLVADMRDTLIVDQNADGSLNPGEELEYVVSITNADLVSMQGVQLTLQLDSALTLTGSSLSTSPLAYPDHYQAVGNVPLQVSAASGLLANDRDPDGSTGLTITAQTITTALGGQVVLQADGAFSYTPPAGTTDMTDAFTYNLVDQDGHNDPGSVAIRICGIIWFCDNSGLNGDGRLHTPFNNLADLMTASAVGDTLFLFEGSTQYTGGIALKSKQTLFGQGQDLLVQGQSLVTATQAPVIVHVSGPGITLSTDNTIAGLDLGACFGPAIKGSQFGTLDLSGVSIHQQGNLALDLEHGIVNADFNQISSTQSMGSGILLQHLLGSFTAQATTCSQSSGNGIQIQSWTSGAIDLGDLTLSAAGGHGMSITQSAGSLEWSAASAITGAGGVAIEISGGSLALTARGQLQHSSTQAALDISDHTGSVHSLLSSTIVDGTGLQFSNADGQYDFDGSTTLRGGDAGIDILSNSTGTFDFSAATTIDQPVQGAIRVHSSSCSLTYAGAIVNSDGFALDVFGSAGSHLFTGSLADTGGSGVRYQAFSGTATLQNLSLVNGIADGIEVSNSSGQITFANVTIKDPVNASSRAIDLSINPGSNLSFQDMNIQSSTAGVVGLYATLNGQISISGTSTIKTAAQALNVFFATLSASLDTVSVTSASEAALDLNTCSGSLVIQGGALQGLAKEGVKINGGSLNLTYGGRIYGGAGHAVSVQSINSGLVDFNERITGPSTWITGANGGVITFGRSVRLSGSASTLLDLSNNSGAKIRFLDTLQVTGLQPTSTLFSAVDGGELEVQSGASALIGAGRPLVLQNILLGSGGINFASVSTSQSQGSAMDLLNLSGGKLDIRGGAIDRTATGLHLTNVAQADFQNLLFDTGVAVAVRVAHHQAAPSTLTFHSLTTKAKQTGILLASTGSGQLDVDLSGLSMSQADSMVVLRALGSGTVQLDFDSSTLDGATTSAITLQTGSTSTATVSASLSHIQIGAFGVTSSGSLQGSGLLCEAAGSADMQLALEHLLIHETAASDVIIRSLSSANACLDADQNDLHFSGTQLDLSQQGTSIFHVVDLSTLSIDNHHAVVNQTGTIQNIAACP